MENQRHIDWDDRYATGVDSVDRQHRGLIDLINDLYGRIGEGRGDEALDGVFGELQRYAETHFATEERLLRRHPVAGYHPAGHLEEHAGYRYRIADLRARHARGERLLPIQVLSFVGRWWQDHIAHSDRVFERLAGEVSANAPDGTVRADP